MPEAMMAQAVFLSSSGSSRFSPVIVQLPLSDDRLSSAEAIRQPAAAAFIAHLILLPTAFVGPEVTVRLIRRS